jgi:hypothetical protein
MQYDRIRAGYVSALGRKIVVVRALGDNVAEELEGI